MLAGMRRRPSLVAAMAFIGAWLELFLPIEARGHGSLPIAQEIMWQGDTMMVSAAYWGLFVGTDGGRWRWICEEAINANQSRQMAVISDGTIYATDRTGLSVSRDGGCTFMAITSALSSLQVVALRSDPVLPRAWALANRSDALENSGLFYSDDTGQSWQRAYAMPDHLPMGLRISKDGKTLLIGSVTNGQPYKGVLHLSTDGGMTFAQRALSYNLDGQPLGFFKPTWIDPRQPSRLYLQAAVADGTALLRLDGASDPTEVLRAPGGITDMALTVDGKAVLVATTKGLYAAEGDGPFTKRPTLGAAQCLSPHREMLYACAWNWAPDNAAVAHLNSDASAFTKVFQFGDIESPVDCPAGTTVAEICPFVFANYADQLGVKLPASPTRVETAAQSGCAYTLLARPPGPGSASLGTLLGNGLITLCMLSLRRLFVGRRRGAKKASAAMGLGTRR